MRSVHLGYTNYMNTRFIGVKELRANFAKVSADAFKKKQRVIVLRKNQPMCELTPLSKADLQKFRFDAMMDETVKRARTEKTYSTEEVLAMLARKRV